MIFTDQNLRQYGLFAQTKDAWKWLVLWSIQLFWNKKIRALFDINTLKKAAIRINRWPKTRAKNKVT